jgi:hypothetical protein
MPRPLVWPAQGYYEFCDIARRNRAVAIRTEDKSLSSNVNYDTILEQAMLQVLGIAFDDLTKYSTHPNYRLIKLHGSVNWGRVVDVAPVPLPSSPQRVIEEVGHLRISNQYRLVKAHPMLKADGALVFPAIAIPVEKKDEFVCPEEHVLALDEALSSVTKIITIGWRATEAEFLTKLKSKLSKTPQLMVVSGDAAGAQETLVNLGPYAAMPYAPVKVTNGFTGLIYQIHQLDDFLRS